MLNIGKLWILHMSRLLSHLDVYVLLVKGKSMNFWNRLKNDVENRHSH